MPLILDGAKGSYIHRDCCCFEAPHSLNLGFQVFVFGKLFRGFDYYYQLLLLLLLLLVVVFLW